MPGVSNAFLLAAHIACAAAFGAPYAPRLPGTFSGAAPNLRSLPALADLTALSRAENAPAALSSLAVEHSRVSRRQLCVWGVVIASALTGAPARANENTPAAQPSAADIVPFSLTAESGEEETIDAAAAHTAALRVQAAGGTTQWTLLRESFLGKWTEPSEGFGKVAPASAEASIEVWAIDHLLP
mmetsp:Transcript_38358/g.90747  ORF Transcript_38358/g.90747 Transcript_38358/m.90747 type:complete len:185 (-) Transcript_38358:146-700(-)|eukprot:CAMPEP_0180130154 /NCGR_PEP_ID=MMETSP0986-20121125/7707_1 /TAXON_ID=697907 /ORGANISM="non described non described, Strain CCMP2293" /LENGTH=184 /DNA_ID=CAMNT_0022069889 /DNA_START=313 /DNA_END=867 /DNA_ORIENTATION=+